MDSLLIDNYLRSLRDEEEVFRKRLRSREERFQERRAAIHEALEPFVAQTGLCPRCSVGFVTIGDYVCWRCRREMAL